MAAKRDIRASQKAIANRLRLTRVAFGKLQGRTRGLSQVDFCKLVGVKRQRWNNAETGHQRLGLDAALMMVKALGISLDWIYLGRKGSLPAKLAIEISKLERQTRKPG
jgi:transcriptional regulator with XRE-family HTH domain